jgi:hypothetical protein
LIKKILIYGALIFAVYKGLGFYTAYTIAEKASACGGRFGLLEGLKESELSREKFLAGAKAWRCVKRDMNFLEGLFFKIPDAWINPPRQYVDPPFTVEELADDFVADKNIADDISVLAKAYEGEINRFDRIKGLLAVSDKTKLRTEQVSQRYGEASEELGSIIGKLSEHHPNTRQVNELHQAFIDALKRMTSDGRKLSVIFNSVNSDLEEGETILALSKNEIAENRSRLLNIRDHLARAETEIQNKLDSLKQNEKAAMEALDGLEALGRKHGVAGNWGA